ncbi:MAG: hypothetical protein GFGODING_02066 [Flavobacteriales bacterium]|nr:hypothetical protein [Flavobacteriales bacterium]
MHLAPWRQALPQHQPPAQVAHLQLANMGLCGITHRERTVVRVGVCLHSSPLPGRGAGGEGVDPQTVAHAAIDGPQVVVGVVGQGVAEVARQRDPMLNDVTGEPRRIGMVDHVKLVGAIARADVDLPIRSELGDVKQGRKRGKG